MADQQFHTLDLSRRKFFTFAGIAAGAGVLLSAAAGPAVADSKFSQSMAKYQPTPKGSASCATCTQFEPPDSCKVVAGKIAATGWCLLYARKG
jgi:hypothetical protein